MQGAVGNTVGGRPVSQGWGGGPSTVTQRKGNHTWGLFAVGRGSQIASIQGCKGGRRSKGARVQPGFLLSGQTRLWPALGLPGRPNSHKNFPVRASGLM